MTRKEAGRAQQTFMARGLASAARARELRKYVPADTVLRKLSRRHQVVRSKTRG
jgi:hypothetical protein